MKRLIILTSLVALCHSLLSQAQTYYMTDWAASSQWNYNPALQSKEKVYLYIPGLSGFQTNAGHTGFAFNDVIDDNQLKVGDLIDGLDPENDLLLGFNSDLIALGLKFGNVQLRTGCSAHVENRFTYTKDLLELAWRGNGHPDVIGRRMSLDGFGLNSMSYLSYYLGGSVSLLDNKLNVGVNANFYNGIGTIYTERSQFGLRTSPDDYTITVDGSYEINTSGSDITDEIDLNDFQPLSATTNKGVGLDFGITYSPVEKFTLEASAMNVGSINWTESVENFVLTDQEISYSGFELNEFLAEPDSAGSSLEQFSDSISDLFIPTENTNDFATATNDIYFIRGIVNLNEKMRVSAFFSSQRSFGKRYTNVGALFDKDFGRTLQLRGGLQLFRSKDLMVPLGLIVNGGPVQFSLHTDNILGVISAGNAKHFNASVGLSFRFKKDSKKSKTSKD